MRAVAEKVIIKCVEIGKSIGRGELKWISYNIIFKYNIYEKYIIIK